MPKHSMLLVLIFCLISCLPAMLHRRSLLLQIIQL